MQSYQANWSIPVLDEFDVVVCGGGPAGFSAAIQAGRMGSKTALIEAEGALGGALTTGGNTEMALFYAFGEQIIRGIGWELSKRLARDGWARIPDFSADLPHSQLGVSVDAVMAAHYLDVMCAEAGVHVFFHQPVCHSVTVERDGRRAIRGVVVATKTGLAMIEGHAFVDCTGDGDLAALSGAEFELGDEQTGDLQPGTLRFYPRGYDLDSIDPNFARESFANARQRGELQHGDYWPEPRGGNPYGIFKHGGNNTNHVTMNGADSRSRSQAEIAGRASVARVANWARNHVPGAERFSPFATGSHVCARESRRIVGKERITEHDYCSARQYEDAICYAFYPIDLHTTDGDALVNRFLDKGVHHDVPTIPFGALRPVGFQNLLVAGRCLSSDRLANSAVRVKSPCTAMGQAAGTAAVLAIVAAKSADATNSVVDLDELRIDDVKGALVDSDAIVPGG